MNTATAQHQPLEQTISQQINSTSSQPTKKACLNCSNISCAKASKASSASPMATLPSSAAAETISATSSTPLQPSLQTPRKVLQQQKTAWQRFAAKFAEAHPIDRKPAYLQAHASPPISHYVRRLGRTGVFFFPVMVGFFAWPFAFKAVIQASNQVKAPKPKNSKMDRKRSIDDEAWGMKVYD